MSKSVIFLDGGVNRLFHRLGRWIDIQDVVQNPPQNKYFNQNIYRNLPQLPKTRPLLFKMLTPTDFTDPSIITPYIPKSVFQGILHNLNIIVRLWPFQNTPKRIRSQPLNADSTGGLYYPKTEKYFKIK